MQVRETYIKSFIRTSTNFRLLLISAQILISLCTPFEITTAWYNTSKTTSLKHHRHFRRISNRIESGGYEELHHIVSICQNYNNIDKNVSSSTSMPSIEVLI